MGMYSVIDQPWVYSHVAADKLVSAKPCVLHTITINRCDAGATYVTVYDGVDNGGTVVAIIDVDNGKTYYVLPVTLIYDCQLTVGCYLEFSAAPSTADLTVNYK